MWAEQPGQATDAESVAQIEELADFLRSAGRQGQPHRAARFDPTEAFHIYLRLLDAALSGASTEECWRASASARPACPPTT